MGEMVQCEDKEQFVMDFEREPDERRQGIEEWHLSHCQHTCLNK